MSSRPKTFARKTKHAKRRCQFNDDGTHEPVGERDVPWNARDPWTGAAL